MEERELNFIREATSASMITLRRDGTAHATRVGVGVVDGKIWSSGTQSRQRTRHLRRDPRSTLFVFDTAPEKNWRWLTLESTVSILEGDDAPQLNMRLFQVMQARMPSPPPPGRFNWFGQEMSTEEFLGKMVEEGRLIYEFDVKRTYGMF
jgi:PPOX class probable F420-dependent enzyme